jgi:hypothetical protein
MDAIKQQLNKPLVAGIVGLVIGLIVGLVVLGWWLFPVEWVDATPAQLNADWQNEYMRMAVEAYSFTQDAATAEMRFEALGDTAPDVLLAVAKDPQSLSVDQITAFYSAVQSQAAATAGEGTVVAPAEGTAVEQPAEEQPSSAGTRTALIVVCLVGLLAAAAVFAYLFLRSRSKPAVTPVAEGEEMQEFDQPFAAPLPAAEYQPPVEGGPALVRFMAAYNLGNDQFDDSFSIESQVGEFLGECGVGISETIGVGDPKRVTAFEVWLFDKNDIQTVTKVLMSNNAFNDGNARQRLAARGEPLLVQPGMDIELETQTLRLVARVVDMAYGDGALPAESYFSRFVLDLSIWQHI